MNHNIRGISVFRITMEREKLAKDEKTIRKIFEMLEECGIPCECIAINIDWLAIVIRESEYGKFGAFAAMIGQKLDRINISIERRVVLLCVEGEQITSRGIGMIVSSLTMQNIEIKMHRYLQCHDRFMIGVASEASENAKRIITEIIGAHYQI